MSKTELRPRNQPREPEQVSPRQQPGEMFTVTGPYDGKGMPSNARNHGQRMQAFQNAVIGGLDTASFGLSGTNIVAVGASNYNQARSGHGEIYLGERVELILPRGHPSLYQGDEAQIIRLCMPFTEHCTDDIVQVQTISGSMGWIKPNELRKIIPFANPTDFEKSRVVQPEKVMT